MRRIDQIHLDHPTAGARMLRDILRREGLSIGRRHIATLMRRMGLESIYRKPRTSDKHPGHKVFPYLLRNLGIKRANQVWAMDTTYIAMAKGFVYLSAVIDVASRALLGWRVATTLEACHGVDALEQAFAKYGVPEIVNTDQGAQFTAEEFVNAVRAKGCEISMDGRGAWRDNVFVERFWRTIKYEEVYLHAYDSVAIARQRIDRFVHWYNHARAHTSVDKRPPLEAYHALLPALAQAA
jgi:putative transposase